MADDLSLSRKFKSQNLTLLAEPTWQYFRIAPIESLLLNCHKRKYQNHCQLPAELLGDTTWVARIIIAKKIQEGLFFTVALLDSVITQVRNGKLD